MAEPGLFRIANGEPIARHEAEIFMLSRKIQDAILLGTDVDLVLSALASVLAHGIHQNYTANEADTMAEDHMRRLIVALRLMKRPPSSVPELGNSRRAAET